MKEKEYNLLDEPWIRVLNAKCETEQVSLTDALLHAHEYVDLGGELETQDVVLLRWLLAVLHTVFSRTSPDGEESPLQEEEDAYDRWKELWDMGRFPKKPIREYLEKWRERFWLFHPDRPFCQVAGMKYGTRYDASKLNGELSESSNKIRLFSSYGGNEKTGLSYDQAVRWLLYVNAYDDTSAKPSKEGKTLAKKNGVEMESPGVGWMGKLGLIIVKGSNLFETLMLNLVLVQVHRDGIIPLREQPVWEKDEVSDKERNRISMPDNLSELYTLQSRRLLLRREDGSVTGYILLGGDFFEREEAFIEPMTIWRRNKTRNTETDVPKRHDKEKQIWREFSSIYSGESCREPGVIAWNKALIEEGLIQDQGILRSQIVSVQYGDKDFFVNHVFSDEMSVQRGVIVQKGKKWQIYIQDEIEKCDELAKEIGNLSQKIYLASGGDEEKRFQVGNRAKEQLYYQVDVPFRKWIQSIDVSDLEGERAKKMEWRKMAREIGFSCAEGLTVNLDAASYIGKTNLTKINGKEVNVHYSASKAINEFYVALNRIYPERG